MEHSLIADKKPVVQIQHKGYLFLKHYKTDEKTYWRCAQLIDNRKRCSARLVTENAMDGEIIEKGQHEHAIRHTSKFS